MKKFFYRVQKNDTVSGLANRFNLPVTEIIAENNLKNEVEEGDVLLLEKNERPLYTVKPTDTVFSLAEKFDTTPEKILKDNRLPYIWFGLKIKI